MNSRRKFRLRQKKTELESLRQHHDNDTKIIVELNAKLVLLQLWVLCTVCEGTGNPGNDKPCICGGTGKAQDAYRNLSREYVELQCALRGVDVDILRPIRPPLVEYKEGEIS